MLVSFIFQGGWPGKQIIKEMKWTTARKRKRPTKVDNCILILGKRITFLCHCDIFAVCLPSVAGRKMFNLRTWFMTVQPALERAREKKKQAEIMCEVFLVRFTFWPAI